MAPLVDGGHGHLGLHVVVHVSPQRKRERAGALVLDAEDPAVKPEIVLKIVPPLPGEVGQTGRNALKHAALEGKPELVNATAQIATVQALTLETVTNRNAILLLGTAIGWR